MSERGQGSWQRGIFERPPGSGIWWINYYEHGKQHREKIGKKSAAIAMYQARKAAILEGRKLPPLRKIAAVSVSELIDDMLEHVKTQGHKDRRNYEGRGNIVRRELGSRDAEALTSQELETWLAQNTKTPSTFNRYKSLFSLAYKIGIRNKKVTHNPARGEFIPMRREPRGRLRFLNRDEYELLYDVIEQRFPTHLAEYIVAVHTGMRLSEQYTIELGQFDRKRRAIDLDKTKNGDARTVHLNADALHAIESVIRPKQKRSDRIFAREDRSAMYPDRREEHFNNRSWFEPAVASAGIPRLTWHNLRHTFCSWLAMAGATSREIMEAAGHRTMSQVARYSHLSPQHTQSVVDRIAGTRTANSHMHQNMHQKKSGNPGKTARGKKLSVQSY